MKLKVCPRIFKKSTKQLSRYFSYTQLASFFVPQKKFFYVYDDTHAFFFSSSVKF